MSAAPNDADLAQRTRLLPAQTRITTLVLVSIEYTYGRPGYQP